MIIKWLYEEPDLLFSVKEVENRFATSNQTARNDLVGLQNMGYLDMIELNRKEKGFCKSKKFNDVLKREMSNAE